MVSFSEALVIIAFFWLVIISIASRYDLQKYNIFISTGLLIWKMNELPPRITKQAERIKFWKKFGNISGFFAILVFFAIPLILIVNILKGLLFFPSPILFSNPFATFRAEVFILLIPAIFIIISFHQLIRTIIYCSEKEEIQTSGFIIIGVIISFFSQLNFQNLNSRGRIRVLSVSLLSNLILLLLLIPLFSGSNAAVNSLYGDPQGAIIVTVAPNSPAIEAGLMTSDVIQGIKLLKNNQVVFEINVTSASIFQSTLRVISPGDEFIVVLESDQINVVGEIPPSDATIIIGSYIGVEVIDFKKSAFKLPSLFPLWFEIFSLWMLNISMVYGLYVILPLPRSDGSEFLKLIAESWDINLSPNFLKVIHSISFILLIANILLV